MRISSALYYTLGPMAYICLQVWNWSKGRVTHEGRGHSGAVTRVSLSPDGHVLASVGKDGALLFWKIP